MAKGRLTAAMVFIAVLLVPSAAQGAPPQLEEAPALAAFEGSRIDLADGWGAARVCIVWRQQGVLDCYRTRAEAEARSDRLSRTSASTSSTSCWSPLQLFADAYYGGRELWFFDRGYWQNLRDYGFDNQLSSYAVGACYAHLAESAWGGGYWYPGNTSAWAEEPNMYWSWQDRVSSIYIG